MEATRRQLTVFLEADERHGTQLTLMLADLNFDVHGVRTHGELLAALPDVPAGTALLVDYTALVQPRLAGAAALRCLVSGPLGVMLPATSMGLATRLGRVGVDETMVRPVDPKVLERLLFPDRVGEPVVARTMSLEEITQEHIQRTLMLHDGNVTRAAAALGMRRTSLQRKLPFRNNGK
jgi:ActR/RegA family two-component response regulator